MSDPRMIAAICNDLECLLAQSLNEPGPGLELASEVENHPDGVRAVGLLLLVLEKNPHLDWGTPGAVVHAVECFSGRGYEPLLWESLRRNPTRHTLWMANRVINALPRRRRRDYLSVIREVAERVELPDDVRQLACQFIEFQQSSA
jgi:hypothetical protein